jgi:transcriptional regulator with XRE-family HTH domain
MALEKNQVFIDAFGQRIKDLRTAKGYSKQALADMLNIDKHQLFRIEAGEIATSIMTAYRLAEVFGITVSVLFDFEVGAKEL